MGIVGRSKSFRIYSVPFMLLCFTSLEFFVNMEVVVSEIRVYNRPLQPHEVERLSELAFEKRAGE